jgi:hypothetical protein
MLFVSCNTEELFIEPVGEEVINLEDEEEVLEEDEEPGLDASLPCDFDLNTIEPNTTILINCMMDLDGATINVPANVSIVYEGGDIINGTLNFSGNGIISGELLNSTLILIGATPQLKDPVFNFDPNRWEIVEGVVNDDVSYNNKLIINDIMQKVKEFGATTIKIDKLDAYFYTRPFEKPWQPQYHAIAVPSNIHLIMTDNTHLRTQPNDFKNTVLLTAFKADNSIIEGGILYGDRDTHDYSDASSSHEWGHLVLVKASKNVTVKGMTLIDAGGDGLLINALGHTYDSNYTPSDNILITNNKIIRARRNGLSITEGRNIIIDGNEFIDSGTSTALSKGTAPQWALDIEPVWSNGIKYEIVEHVIIRNNIERGSEKGGFINARGWYITYENNTMENTIAMGETIGSIVRNNTFENPGNSVVAILAGMNDKRGYGNERNHSNEVYGNTIIGFDKGIFLQDPGIDLHSNTITNCGSGIQILNTRDSKIRDNTIINETGGEGISNKVSDYIDNVDIYNNIIKVNGSPFRFSSVNQDDATIGFKIIIRDNETTSLSNSSFNKIRGFDFKNNLCHNSGIRVVGSSKINVLSNTFENGVIRISGGNSDLNFIENIITGGQCFYEDNSLDYAAVNIVKENNTCN